LRDLWEHRDLGLFTASYTAIVDPHATVVLRASQRATTKIDSTTVTLQPCSTILSAAQTWSIDSTGSQGNSSALTCASDCLDLFDCKLDRPSNMQIYQCHPDQSGCGAFNQQYFFDISASNTTIRSAVNTSYCLTVTTKQAVHGKIIETHQCNDTATQKFTFFPISAKISPSITAFDVTSYMIKSADGKQCITA